MWEWTKLNWIGECGISPRLNVKKNRKKKKEKLEHQKVYSLVVTCTLIILRISFLWQQKWEKSCLYCSIKNQVSVWRWMGCTRVCQNRFSPSWQMCVQHCWGKLLSLLQNSSISKACIIKKIFSLVKLLSSLLCIKLISHAQWKDNLSLFFLEQFLYFHFYLHFAFSFFGLRSPFPHFISLAAFSYLSHYPSLPRLGFFVQFSEKFVTYFIYTSKKVHI